ncbi:MAG: response regulator, partial [Spirochaeta sp.]
MNVDVRQLLDSLPIPGVLCRSTDEIEDINPQFARLFQVDAGAVRGKKIYDLMSGYDGKKSEELCLYRHVDTDEAYYVSVILLPDDWYILQLQRVPQDSQEQNTVSQLAQLEHILSALNNGVLFYADSTRRVGWINRAGLELLDSDESGVLDKRSSEVQERLCTTGGEGDPVAACFRTHAESWSECTSPTGAHLIQHAYPVHDARNRFLGVVQTIRDITFRKKMETQLQEALDEADSANIIKDQFIANISHELRTPLNGIVGISELLLRSAVSPEQERFISMIQQSGNRLHEVVQEILAFTQLETDELRNQEIRFHIGTLVQQTSLLYKEKAEQKGLQFEVAVDAELQTWVVGQPGRLRQLLRSLLDNAVKFTPEGRINVDVRKPDDARNNGVLVCEFTISDTGIGIAPEDRSRIFEPFVQVEAGFTREYGGIGLGLSLAKRQVHALGSELRLESDVGAGTSVQFRLELRRADSRPDERAEAVSESVQEPEEPVEAGTMPQAERNDFLSRSASAAGGMRVLVAEDDRINQRVITAILRAQGAVVDAVENGREAVQALEEAEYDVVLMDLQMPEMDGIQATQIIRDPDSGGCNHSVPIIAVTAFTSEIDRTRCLDAGMNDFLS